MSGNGGGGGGQDEVGCVRVVHFNPPCNARQTAEVLQITALKWNRVQLSCHANLIKAEHCAGARMGSVTAACAAR